MPNQNRGVVRTRSLREKRFQRPQRAWKRLRAGFRPFEEKGYMRYNKVLGFGGFGIVQQWEVYKPDGTFDRTVAIKTVTRSDHKSSCDALKREIWWNKRFTGSEHLVQLVNLDPEVTRALDINNENTEGVPIMVMEELGRGSLGLLLSRISAMKRTNSLLPVESRGIEYIPNRALWSIFLCLVRACIGMAYPSADPLDRRGLNVRESIADVPEDARGANIIHFDIDIFNTFVADPKDCGRDVEHNWAPVVKIADYGCMVEWDDNWDDRKKRSSLWGKNRYKAPEQFPWRAFNHGTLGPHTNVYQIGNVMHDLITMRQIPFSQRERKTREAAGGAAQFSTYGWRLLESSDYVIQEDWGRVDLELRELVAGCMAQEPAWRPDMGQLERLIESRMGELTAQAEHDRLHPDENPFAPGEDTPGEEVYRRRIPMWRAEPDEFVERFYREYFWETWGDGDRYANYWDNRTLTPDQELEPASQPANSLSPPPLLQ
ncbi:kinase-like protein [Xylaria palmicola]|nr:kinase-like protein [Xylaria palmicola]